MEWKEMATVSSIGFVVTSIGWLVSAELRRRAVEDADQARWERDRAYRQRESDERVLLETERRMARWFKSASKWRKRYYELHMQRDHLVRAAPPVSNSDAAADDDDDGALTVAQADRLEMARRRQRRGPQKPSDEIPHDYQPVPRADNDIEPPFRFEAPDVAEDDDD